MAADPDPYFALPMLRGAPAYARPPRLAPETERPFDPDDLPIAAAQMSDEPAFTGAPFSSASYQSIGSELLLAAVPVATPASPLPPPAGVGASSAGTDPATGAAPSASATGSNRSRLRLRALTNRLGPRSK